VATVGIDGATNAGILAARILALADPDLAQRLAAHRAGLLAKSRDQDDEVAAALS
jgi:phosphoribosylcarboxyaminoimidazole (NCAIR) mutase